MSKFNERLTLVANLAVVAGVIFLGAEMRQNTEAIRAQTRDSITEKQMTWLQSIYGTSQVAEILSQANRLGASDIQEVLSPSELTVLNLVVQANLREWENSFYQYESGLFTAEEFEARRVRWRANMALTPWAGLWPTIREQFAPSFRAEVDRIAGEVEVGPLVD